MEGGFEQRQEISRNFSVKKHFCFKKSNVLLRKNPKEAIMNYQNSEFGVYAWMGHPNFEINKCQKCLRCPSTYVNAMYTHEYEINLHINVYKHMIRYDSL